jgi:tRNA G26 N,N-dimethylase Trm1
MTKIICDVCGEEIKQAGPMYVTHETQITLKIMRHNTMTTYELDYHYKCFHEKVAPHLDIPADVFKL